MKMEAIVPVVADHRNICQFDTQTEVYQHIVRLLTDAICPNTYVDNDYSAVNQIRSTSQSTYEVDESVGAMTASSSEDSEIHSTDILPVIHDKSIPPRTPKLPFLDVQYTPTAHFFDRADYLDRINQILSLGGSEGSKIAHAGTPCVVISGDGGIGKTQLAMKYAYTARGKYDAVLWINASTILGLSDEFLRISKELGLRGTSELEDRVVAKSMVLKWLGTTDTFRLLVFDNADYLEQLHDFWPTSANGSILVTSRDHDAANRLYQSDPPTVLFLLQFGIMMPQTGYTKAKQFIWSRSLRMKEPTYFICAHHLK